MSHLHTGTGVSSNGGTPQAGSTSPVENISPPRVPAAEDTRGTNATNAATSSASEKSPKKKLVVCCDGTWNNSDARKLPLTNVARIARCVKSSHSSGTAQIVYYQTGIGSSGWSKVGKAIEGLTGKGISANIREAYSFICHNFLSRRRDSKDHTGDDEIILIGFSRGAFTVRSVASLIYDVGVLTKGGLGALRQIFDIWEEQPRLGRDELQARCEAVVGKGELLKDVRIRACAVWDTVGSLGIPRIAFLPQYGSRKLAFVNSKVCPNIENAFQALALNEHRESFIPTLWQKPTSSNQTLKQCWFLGCHSDVGGGNDRASLSNISLVWMIDQLQSPGILDLELKALRDFTTRATHTSPLPRWTEVEIKIPGILYYGMQWERDVFVAEPTKSKKGIFRMDGSKYRRPGQQHWNHESSKGRSTEVNNELMHFTVRALIGSNMSSLCKSLQNAAPEVDKETKEVVWKFVVDEKSQRTATITEDKPDKSEVDLLKEWMGSNWQDWTANKNAGPVPKDDAPAMWDLHFAQQLLPLLEEERLSKIEWKIEKSRVTRSNTTRTRTFGTFGYRSKMVTAPVHLWE